jgi:cytidylate kinase
VSAGATEAVSVITMSREFGAGGSDLGQAIGARLGWTVLDRDIVHRVAERLRMDDSTVEKLDEHPPSLLARIATVLIVPQPDIYSFPPVRDVPSADAIAGATTEVIEEVASQPPLVVVGHGAQCIFGGRPDALHVRVTAPAADRIRRICERMNVDPAFAANLLRKADQDRQAYVQRYFHRDWHSSLLYDVQFNTSRVSIEEAATMIERLIALR